MKLWIPALLLLSVFAGATLWQSRWTAELREHRDRAWDRARGSDAEAPFDDSNVGVHAAESAGGRPHHGSDRARVIVGRPSGAAPVAVPERRSSRRRGRFLEPPAAGSREDGVQAAPPPAPTAVDVEPDFTMVVRGGQSLSVICQQHYGTARPSLVRSLAEYNGLADADAIVVGQTLHLPAIERLLGTSEL